MTPSVVFVTEIPPVAPALSYSIRVKYTRSSRVTVSQGSDWRGSWERGIRMFVENVFPPSEEVANATRWPPPLWVNASFQPTKIFPWELITIVGSTWYPKPRFTVFTRKFGENGTNAVGCGPESESGDGGTGGLCVEDADPGGRRRARNKPMATTATARTPTPRMMNPI